MYLAQYSIRSKQDYIFKTNRVLEIVGASENIRNIWDVLLDIAENTMKCQTCSDPFCMDTIQNAFATEQLDVVELFCGGGNETMLFRDKSCFQKLNRDFTHKLLVEYPGLVPMAVGIEAEGDYSKDYANLMEAAELKRNTMTTQNDDFTVPFAMMDRTTMQPYSRVVMIDGNAVRKSEECFQKHKKGKNLRDQNDEIKLFDEMVTKKGKESLLAVVHADGNNMSAKIMEMLDGETEYEKAIPIMRRFTDATRDCFEIKGDEALRKCFNRLQEDNADNLESKKLLRSSLAYRRIIGSGDDVTFVCNARFAMDYVRAYLNAVQNYQNDHPESQWKYSSCAGICIFHSHYPFSRAYQIAEQACDDFAKSRVHSSNGSAKRVEQGWVDFHVIYSGISGNLKEIRKVQETERCIARPWLVSYDEKDGAADHEIFKYVNLEKLLAAVKKYKVERTSIKELGSAFERSKGAALKELTHIYGHHCGFEDEVKRIFGEEDNFLKAMYDLSEIYDLWYDEVK